MISPKTKFEAAIVVFVLGLLFSGGITAVRTEFKVEEHDKTINAMSSKIDEISSNVNFIRGKLEKNQ
jgi:uncharacterized membrane protein